MNYQVKSFLILSCILTIRIIIDRLSTSTWQHRRSIALSEIVIQGRLLRHIERIIDIHSEEQRTEQSLYTAAQKHGGQSSLSFYRQHLMTNLSSDQWQRL